MHYCKHNQVVTPVAAVVPDVISLLEKINTSSSTWYVVIDLANDFFSLLLLVKTTRVVCFQLAKPTKHIHCHILEIYQVFSLVA